MNLPYKPQQPTAARQGDVSYTEYPPDARLAEFIYCYWCLHTAQKLAEGFEYNVVADGCIDIFFEMENPQQSFVMGFSDSVTPFQLGESFNYFGIRFLPAAFTRLFRTDASQLRNMAEELHLVVPAIAAYIAGEATDNREPAYIGAMLDRWLLKLATKSPLAVDPRFYNALEAIMQGRGAVAIETGLDTGISPRQLRRMFEFHIGTGAKSFSRVIRFQNALALGPEALNEKAWLDLGYYDQAHFIKEFREFYGITPGKVI